MGKKKQLLNIHSVAIVNVGKTEHGEELFTKYLNYYLQISNYIHHPREIKNIVKVAESYRTPWTFSFRRYASHSCHNYEGKKAIRSIAFLLNTGIAHKYLHEYVHEDTIYLDITNTRKRVETEVIDIGVPPDVVISYTSKVDLWNKVKAIGDKILEGSYPFRNIETNPKKYGFVESHSGLFLPKKFSDEQKASRKKILERKKAELKNLKAKYKIIDLQTIRRV